MDKTHFEQLVRGVKEMRRHMAGNRVRGTRTTRRDTPGVQAIRKAANISQSQFASPAGRRGS